MLSGEHHPKRCEVVSPSDLQAQLPGTVRVGGRVLDASEGQLQLADAFCSVTVHLRDHSPLPHRGQLVVVQARLEAKSRELNPDRAGDTDDGVRDAGATGATRLVDGRLLSGFAGDLRPDGERQRFLSAGVGRLLRARVQAEHCCRDYFAEQRFLEVHTPVRVSAPGTDLHLEPRASEDGWLITSPEFHMKRLLVGGLPRIFQFATCSRKEERGAWHQSEFTMLEWYRAFSDMAAVMQDTEQLVRRLAVTLRGSAEVVVDGREIDVTLPFRHMSVREAYSRYAGVADACELAASDEDAYFEAWVDRVEPALTALAQPLFLVGFPAAHAALAQLSTEDPSVAQRFELVIGGVELCNGYAELTCPVIQRQRFEQDLQRRAARGKQKLPIDEALVAALDEGMPPSGGNALGFDRLLALCLGVPMDHTLCFPA